MRDLAGSILPVPSSEERGVATPYTVLVVEQIDVVRRITKRTSADLRSGRMGP
jgi:hypothetical protein